MRVGLGFRGRGKGAFPGVFLRPERNGGLGLYTPVWEAQSKVFEKRTCAPLTSTEPAASRIARRPRSRATLENTNDRSESRSLESNAVSSGVGCRSKNSTRCMSSVRKSSMRSCRRTCAHMVLPLVIRRASQLRCQVPEEISSNFCSGVLNGSMCSCLTTCAHVLFLLNKQAARELANAVHIHGRP